MAKEAGLFFELALLADGWSRNVRLVIQDGRIARISTGSPASANDEVHGVGLPGLANVHSHGFQRGLAGAAEFRGGADNFWSWRETMYRFVLALSPEDVEAISALAYAEMLEGGFTRVGEFHYLHNDPSGQSYDNTAEMVERIVAAADITGIGLTLLPVLYERGGFDGRSPNPAQRRFCKTVDQFEGLIAKSVGIVRRHDGAILGVAPHSLRAVSAPSLAALAPMMGQCPTHIHIAEQRREVTECELTLKARPVQWLLDHMAVDSHWCLIHATHTDKTEVRNMARSGAVVGLCPISEANLGDGIFNLPNYLETDGGFGIGSDSNILLSGIEELRTLEYGQRLTHEARNIAASGDSPSTGRTLFDAACRGGAQALGTAGGLAEGLAADIIAVDGKSEVFAGREGDGLLDSLIFAGSKTLIRGVWCAGRKLVQEGRHIYKDRIVSRYLESIARLNSA